MRAITIHGIVMNSEELNLEIVVFGCKKSEEEKSMRDLRDLS